MTVPADRPTIRVLFVCTGVHERLHWGIEDPVDAQGTDEERLVVLRQVLAELDDRVVAFIPGALEARTLSPT